MSVEHNIIEGGSNICTLNHAFVCWQFAKSSSVRCSFN